MKISSSKWPIFFLMLCSFPQSYHFTKLLSNVMDEYLKVTDEIISKSKSYNKLMDNFRQNWESPFTYLIKRGYIPAEAKPDNLSCDAIRQMQRQYAENPENAGESMDSENIKVDTNLLNTKDIRRNTQETENVCSVTTEATPEETTTLKNTTDENSSPDDGECDEYYEDVTECYYYDDENDNKTETTTTSNKLEAVDTESSTKCAPKITTTTENPPTTLPKCKPTEPNENPFQKKYFGTGKIIPYKYQKFQYNRPPLPYSQKEQRKVEKQENKDENISHETALKAALQLAQKIAENTVAEYSKNRSQLTNTKSQISPNNKMKRAEDLQCPFHNKQKTQFVKADVPILYAQIMPMIPYKNPQKSQEATWQFNDVPMIQVWHADHPHMHMHPNSYPYTAIPQTPIPIHPELTQPNHSEDKSVAQATSQLRLLTTQPDHLEEKNIYQPPSPVGPLLTQLRQLQDKTGVQPLLTQSSLSQDKHIEQASHPGHPKPTQPSHLQDKSAEQAAHPGHPQPTQPSNLQDKPAEQAAHPGHPKPTQPSHLQDKPEEQAAHPGHPHPTQPSHLQDKPAEEATHPGHPHPTKPSRLQDTPILEDLHSRPQPTPPSQKQSFLQKLFQYGRGKQEKALLSQGARNEKDRLKDKHRDSPKDASKISHPSKSNKEPFSDSYLNEDTNSLIGKEMSYLSKNLDITGKNNDYFDNNKDDYFYEKPDSYIALNAIYVVHKKGDKGDNKNQESVIEDIKNLTTTNATGYAVPVKHIVRKTKRAIKRNIKSDRSYFGPSYNPSNDFGYEKGSSDLEFSKYDKPKLNYFSKSQDLDSENMISNSNIDNGLYNPTNYRNLGNDINEQTGTNFLNSLHSKGQTGNNIMTAADCDNQEKYFDWQHARGNSQMETDFTNSVNMKTPYSKSTTENKDYYAADSQNEGSYKNLKAATDFLGSSSANSQMSNDILGSNIFSNQDKQTDLEHSETNEQSEPNYINIMKLKNQIIKAHSEGKDFYPFKNDKTGTDFSNSGCDILKTNVYRKQDRDMGWQETEPDYLNSIKSQTSKANAENKNTYPSDFENRGSYRDDKMKTNFLNNLIAKTQNDMINPNHNNNQNKEMDWHHSKMNEETRFDYLNPMKNEANTDDKIFSQTNFENAGSYKNDKTETNFNSLELRSETGNDITNPIQYNSQEKQKDWQFSTLNEEKASDVFDTKSRSNKVQNIDEISGFSNSINKEFNSRVNKQTGSLNPKRQTNSKAQRPAQYHKKEKNTDWQHLKVKKGAKTNKNKHVNSKIQSHKVKAVDKVSSPTNTKNVENKKESQIHNKFLSSADYDNDDDYDDWQYPVENTKTDTDFSNTETKASITKNVAKAAYSNHFENIRNNRNEKIETRFLDTMDSKGPVGSDTQNPTHYDNQEKYKDCQQTILNEKNVHDLQDQQSNKGNTADESSYPTHSENVGSYKNEKADINSLNTKIQIGSDVPNSNGYNKEEKPLDWHYSKVNDKTPINYLNSLTSKSQPNKDEDIHAKGLQLRTIVKVDNENATNNNIKELNSDNKEKNMDISKYTDLKAPNSQEIGKDFLKLINYDKFIFGNNKISETNDHSKDDYSKSMETKDQFDYGSISKSLENNLDMSSQESQNNMNSNTQKENFLNPYEYSGYDNSFPSLESQIPTKPIGESITQQRYKTPSGLLFTPFDKQPNMNYEKTEYEINRSDAEIEKAASLDRNRYPQIMYKPAKESDKNNPSELLFTPFDKQPNINYEKTEYEINRNNAEIKQTASLDKNHYPQYLYKPNEETEKVLSMNKNQYSQYSSYNPSEKISSSEMIRNNGEKESTVKKKPHPQYYASEKILNLYRSKNIPKDSEDFSKKNHEQFHQREHMPRTFRDSKTESKASKFENPSKLAPEWKKIVQNTVQNVTRSKFPDMVSKITPNTAHCDLGAY